MKVTIKHATKQRVRFKFPRILSRQEFNLMYATVKYRYSGLEIFPSSSRSGCVVRRTDDKQIDCGVLLDELDSFFEEFFPLGPDLPPTRFESFRLHAVNVSIQVSLVLAVLGWILPILPGTPFFLVAWWLGWRPSSMSSKNNNVNQDNFI